MNYIGDYSEDATVNFIFTTNDSSGGAVAPSTAFEAADIVIYKNNSATQKATTNGVTMTSPFDAITGVHQVNLDTSNDTGDAGFWVTGADYYCVLSPDETVDGQTVAAMVAHFSIENRRTEDIYSDTTVVTSDTAVIESKTSDTHSRLVVVEAAVDSDQTSRTTAISDVKSQLVIVASDTLAIEAKASDTHSRLVVVETAIDSDQTSRATAISDVKSQLTVVASDSAVIESDTTRIELALVTATGALEGTPSATVLQTDLAEATNEHYTNMIFVMTSGDEAGEARRISAYTGVTGTITLSTALSGSPTAAETFAILNIPVLGEPSEFASVVSDTLAIEAKASDTHSRLVVVEAAVDSDQTSRTAAISDVKSRLVVVESAIDSDQTSRTAAISDVKSQLVIVASDTLAIEAKASDTHSRLVVVEAAIDSDQASRTTAISDVKSQLVIVASDTLAIEAKASDTHSRLVVVETAIDSDQTSRATAISDVKSALTIAASDAALLEAAHAEPTGVPAANESPLDKLGRLYMMGRNKVTVTATKKQFFDDGGTAEFEKDLSDDGTTYTETEANAI